MAVQANRQVRLSPGIPTRSARSITCSEGASLVWRSACEVVVRPREPAMSHTTLMPYQPDQMNPGQLAAISYLARYSGQTHALYAYQLRRWFGWCEDNGLDPLVGIQRAHVELYIRHLCERGLMASSVNTSARRSCRHR